MKFRAVIIMLMLSWPFEPANTLPAKKGDTSRDIPTVTRLIPCAFRVYQEASNDISTSHTALRKAYPPVLMYHDIKSKPVNAFDVSITDFREQLDWLKSEGYVTLSLEDFIRYSESSEAFPDKSILITFDDGYRGIYQYAVPELRRRNMKAAFFLVTNTIGITSSGYPHITHEEFNEIAGDELFSIGAHTLTHPDLTKLAPEELRHELEASRAVLNTEAFAYPYGIYNEEVISAVKKAGYKAAFVIGPDKAGHEERYTVPRIYMGVILGKDNQKLFREFITNYKAMPPEAFTERFGPLPE